MEEIAHTLATYGTKYFSFRDGTFTIHRRRTLNFCSSLLARQLDISWECLTRADWLDDELIAHMMEAGCVQIRLGLESGSSRILSAMQKDVTLEEYERAASMLNRRHMFWSAYLMFGMPEESIADIRMTIEMVERLQPSFITVARFVPLPGSPIYEEVTQLGRQIDWRRQNNMCLEQSYSRHIPPEEFQQIMEWVFEYAEKYNQARSDGYSWRDRRLRSNSEPRYGSVTREQNAAGELRAGLEHLNAGHSNRPFRL